MKSGAEKRWPYLVPGIADELFERGDVPMTKEEVRCLAVSRLRLLEGCRVVDIGSGTGTMAIECALLLKKGRVYAVEKDAQAVKLIRENAQAFGVDNIEIIHGSAPEALSGLAPVERIFVGGSGGKMAAVLEACSALLVPGGIMVLNCVLLESFSSCRELLGRLPFEDVSIISVSIARGEPLGSQTMLRPLNPVFIISARKRGELP